MATGSINRDMYVPVRCEEEGTAYSGRWYWEHVRTIAEVNGSHVNRNNIRSNVFHPGDRVVVKYKSRTANFQDLANIT